MIEVKQIETVSQIDQACRLLYKVYSEQSTWNYSEDNPSELRIIEKSNGKVLIDRFTYHKNTVWFGAFDGNKIIGCARLCGPDDNDKFEVQAYSNSKILNKYLKPNNCLEINRIAIDIEYSGQKILNKLFLSTAQYCKKNKYSIFGCSSNFYIKSILKNIEFPLIIEHAFKYEKDDPSLVNFYLVQHNNGELDNLINKSKIQLKKEIQTSSNILEALSLVAEIFPAPFYWHNKEGIVLGINKSCLDGMNMKKIDVVGKSPYNFYPKKLADHILNHNELVMKCGETLSQEEILYDGRINKEKNYLSVKAPLYDDSGNVIGIVGTSVDITAEKEAEKLRVQAEINNNQRSLINDLYHVLETHRIKAIKEEVGENITLNEADAEDIALTNREREVLYLLIAGKTPKGIANHIAKKEHKDISHATINAIINKSLYDKFRVNSTPDLIEKVKLLKILDFMP